MSTILHSQERPKVLEHVAGNVRGLRQQRGLSQEALATASGVSRRMIINIETGDANVSLATLDRLAAALGVRFSDLVRAAVPPDPARIDAIAWAGENPESRGTLLSSFPAHQESELWHWSLAPGDDYDAACCYPGWNETVYVVEGMLDIAFAHGRVSVAAGDFHAFPCDQQRRYVNAGSTRVRFIRAIAY